MSSYYFSETIKEQLKHDAPYAWFLYRQSEKSSLFKKENIETLKEKLDAYMDCFILSEKADDSLLDNFLNLDDWGASYVMAKVALVCNDEERLNQVVENIDEQEKSKELIDALCEMSYEKIYEKLNNFLSHDNEWIRVVAIETLIYFNASIETKDISTLLKKDNPKVQASLLRLIAKNRLKNFDDEIKEFLNSENHELQYHAIYAGCYLDLDIAQQELKLFCLKESAYLKEAITLLYAVIEESEQEEMYEKINIATTSKRIQAHNSLLLGYPEFIPSLIENMKELKYALYWGETFSCITGMDLEDDDLAREEVLTEEEEEIILQSIKEEKYCEEYEKDLALPDVDLITQWWENHKSEFVNSSRYLAGKKVTTENLENIRNSGNQVERNISRETLAFQNRKSIELKDKKIRYTGVLLKEEKKEERDSSIPTIHLKSKQIAPKTGRYQATLAKGHPKEEWLRNSGFDIKTVKLGKNIGTFGFDESEADIVWKYLGE